MVSTRQHLEALRAADQRALTIKDQADKDARALALEGQRYRDEQHNKLREQIVQERGEYVTLELYTQRHEAIQTEIKTLAERVTEFISAQTGRGAGTLDARAVVFAVVGLLIGAATVAVAVMAIIAAVLVAVLKG